MTYLIIYHIFLSLNRILRGEFITDIRYQARADANTQVALLRAVLNPPTGDDTAEPSLATDSLWGFSLESHTIMQLRTNTQKSFEIFVIEGFLFRISLAGVGVI